MAKLEFYIGNDPKYIAVLDDSAVPRKGEYINIRKVTYKIEYVTWAVDAVDNKQERKLRANIILKIRI